MYKFSKEELQSFSFGDSRCFVMPNGLGGYTSTSLINSSHRKHYGYLIASLKPPVERKMILTRINERVVIDDKIYDLESQKYNNYIKENQKYIEEFTLNYIPTYKYNVNGVSIMKQIAPLYGKNTVAVSYVINSSIDSKIVLEPLFNYRDHGDASNKEDLKFTEKEDNGIYCLIPEKNKDIKIKLLYNDGIMTRNIDKYTLPHYCEYDISTGDNRLDTNYKPIHIDIDVKANLEKRISIICTIDEIPNIDAFDIINNYQNRINSLIKKSKLRDNLAIDLVVASDNFLAYRKSTNLKTILAGLPWFTDWGRDTMIAFTGLILVPRRFNEAKEILKSFSLYEKNGLIPNMFPDDGGEPLYNTVDASLWYFYACYKYIKYTKDKEFIKNEIYPTLKRIIKAYSTHTDFSIYMDDDYLIHAGSDQDQITWMDVRINGVAVTPRHGKPVEINALWYNALRTMDYFSKIFDDYDPFYLKLSKKVKKAFNKKFINPSLNSLYDTVDPYDYKIRPNQLYSLALPYKVLEKKYAKMVVDTVKELLYNIYGMRSLSINDKDFKPKYEGPLEERDYEYHMGTTWGFLLGAYFDSYYYVYKDKNEIQRMVNAVIPHLNDGCINGFAEIFDGDVASRTRGCYTQAWSIGELLRSYYENVLK